MFRNETIPPPIAPAPHGRGRPIATVGDRAAAPAVQLAIAGIIGLTVTFNALLAIVSGHVVRLNGAVVTVVQAAIVAAALAVPLLLRPAGMMRWLGTLWLLAILFLLLSVLRERLEPRYVADIATIFGFVMLGLCAGERTMARTLFVLQGLLCIIAVWELASPASFAAVFRVQDYYVATRGFSEASFWSNSDLFVSAERPGGRLLLPGLNIHRGSSLFLEPVSLGNWTIVVTLAIGALWRSLSWRAVALLALGNAVLLVACDGRLAIMVNLLLVPIVALAHRIPRWVPPLALPGTFFALLLAQWLGLIGSEGDTLAGRLSYGMNYLERLGAGPVMGLSSTSGVVGADSGWAYLVVTQSLPGLILIWLALTLPGTADAPARRRMVLGTAIFLSTALPISYSVFSIKTAALLWAFYGFAVARALAAQPAPVRRIAPPRAPTARRMTPRLAT